VEHERPLEHRLTPDSGAPPALSNAEIRQFIHDGFVKIPGAFPRELADQGRAILWQESGCDENDPSTWTKPVIRLGMYGLEPFAKAANTAVLQQAGGGLERISGRFRFGFPRGKILETLAGTSIVVSRPTPATPPIF